MPTDGGADAASSTRDKGDFFLKAPRQMITQLLVLHSTFHSSSISDSLLKEIVRVSSFA